MGVDARCMDAPTNNECTSPKPDDRPHVQSLLLTLQPLLLAEGSKLTPLPALALRVLHRVGQQAGRNSLHTIFAEGVACEQGALQQASIGIACEQGAASQAQQPAQVMP
jgi:hypothetical protein